uniref:Importin N-terminal domain-containing protein n=1 Tax=Leptobrachium leishanense TaxID=445787 RepID=A0A8C5PG40_9ANUR
SRPAGGLLEQILSSLLQPDNAVIQQATVQLKEAVKDPMIIPALCDVLRGSPDMQIRQLAAVLLRRRLTKHYKSIPSEQRETLKSLLLEAIQREPEHKVRYALAQLLAVILRNETLANWPQFIQFVLLTSRSQVPEQRQVGLLVLKCALDLSAGLFHSHFSDLIKLFQQALTDLQNAPVLFYTLQSLTSIVPEMSGNEMNLLRSLISKIITAIRQLIQSNEVQACEAMEVFDELMEGEVSVVVHHLAEIIPFCIELAVNTSLSDNLRVKALTCLSFLIKLKSKSIIKQKMLSPILSALFPIMCVEPPPGQMDPEDQEDEDEILDEETEVQTPKHYAVQVIDMLALHLPPEKLFAQLTPLMEPCLLSANPYQRKAGLMCIAVLSEGCADFIRNKHLKTMIKIVCDALSDESQVVRNAALFAIGQFSENLQPEISEYSDSVLPLLLGYISGVDPCQNAHLTKAYYVLENFVESLGSKIEPYLPALMERILMSLNNANNRVRELSVSALGAIANGAEKLLLPYFSSVMEALKVHLVQTGGEEGKPIQIQCLETLSILVRNLGKDAFLPLTEDCCLLGLGLCDKIDDPDLRRCAYSLFAALSGIMEDSISVHLEKITTLMLLSLKSTEGIVVHYNENRSFLIFDDEAEEDAFIQDEDEEEDPDIKGFTVENSYVDEKEDACLCLGELAYNASSSFFPYLDSCFKEISKHIEAPHSSVRKAAYQALGQLVCSMNNICMKNASEENIAALLSLLSFLIPPCLHGALHDKERSVVMAILDTLNQLLGFPLVAAAVGGVTFSPYFAEFLPLLLNKVKPSCTPAEKSFAAGTLAESVMALGPAVVQFVPQILPAFISGVRDEDKEVRSNSVFGLGVLVEHGGDSISEKDARVLDNVCGAVSRMVLSHANGVPLEQVFPVMLRSLPLKEDFEENSTVFKCIAYLYENFASQVTTQLVDIVRIFSQVLGTKEIQPDTENSLILLLRDMAQRFPQELHNAIEGEPGWKMVATISQAGSGQLLA